MKISLLMPAYNSARFFAAAVESVLAQTHRDFELILIDDGSTDDTLAIARRYAEKDNRVKVITHPNMGMGKSLNDAMQQAAGEWIARLDADDVMLPERFERQLAFLNENPDLIVASSLVQYVDENGKVIGKSSSRFTDRAAVAESKKNHWPVGFHHPAAIFRKDVILGLGGYRAEFWPADDMDLWNRVVDAGHAILVQPEYLTQYRIHASSVTVGKFKTTEEKAQWVEACILARHEQRPEPTWDEFLAQRKAMPLPKRLNARRRDYARAIYKTSVFHFSRRQWTRFVPGLLVAGILEPWYVLQRVVPQFKKS